MIFTVAIDGPAAAGKGTISRAVAEHFGFAHLDTGLLYRAVGAKDGDPVESARTLSTEDLDRGDLRTMEAGQAASRVAVIPEVRAALVDFQRRFARREGGTVLDGRDIGTVICPEAEVKLFVTASAEVRAHRRWLEVGGDEAEVLAEVIERDRRDAERAVAPLKPAEDAVVLDTSKLSVEEAVARAVAIVSKAITRARYQPTVDAINARGHAEVFAQKRGVIERSWVEKSVGRDWAASLKDEFGVEVTNISHNPSDPPDLIARRDGREVRIEVTELVDGELIVWLESMRARSGLPGTSMHREAFLRAQWDQSRFQCEIRKRLESKAEASRNTFDILIVYSAEPLLAPECVERWLRDHPLPPIPGIPEAYLLLDHRPGWRTRHPIFRLI